MTFTAYGIALPGIPEAVAAHHPSRTARWSMPYSSVQATASPFIGLGETDTGLDVGWKGWASYSVAGPPSPSARTVLNGAGEIDAAACFLASVLPFVLPLFDLEPFHGSAVVVDGAGLCLLGDSRAGKSSIAAALNAGGHELIADDACAIDTDGRLWPGPGLLSLRGDIADSDRVLARDGEKTFVAATPAGEPLTLGAIVKLDRRDGASLDVRPLQQREAFEVMTGMARAPDVLANRRLETRFGAVAAAVQIARFGAVCFDAGRHDAASVAAAVTDWACSARQVAPR